MWADIWRIWGLVTPVVLVGWAVVVLVRGPEESRFLVLSLLAAAALVLLAVGGILLLG